MNDNGNPVQVMDTTAKPPANPLQLLEYVTVGASVVGTAAAVITQQVVLVAAPMSASLVLNLVNRRRIEQLTQQTSQITATQMQLVSEQVDRLQNQIPVGLISSSTEASAASLHPEFEAALAAVNGCVESLSQRLSQLEAIPPATGFHLDSEPSALFDTTQFNLEFEQRIDPLEQKIEALAASLQQTSPTTAADASGLEMLKLQMQVQYTDLEASVNHVLEQLQQLPPATHIEQWAASLAELTHNLETYQQRLASLETRSSADPVQLDEEITDISMDTSMIGRQVQSLLNPLEEKIQQLETHASIQAAKPTMAIDELTTLKTQVEALSAQLAASPMPLATANISAQETEELRQIAAQLEASLAGLSLKLDQVTAAVPAALAAHPPAGTTPDLSNVQQHLKSLELKFDMDLARFEEELKQVQERAFNSQPQLNFGSTFNETAEPLDDLSSLDDLLRELETR